MSVEFQVTEDSSAILMMRILGEDGAALQQADVSTATLDVIDIDTSTATVTASSLVVATVFFDTIQNPTANPLWSADTEGFNFKTTIAATAFPTGGHFYTVEVKIVTSGGATIIKSTKVYAEPIWAS